MSDKHAYRFNEGHKTAVDTARSPLQETATTTATEYWIDSCSVDELTYAIERGAVGATTNPTVVTEVLKKEMHLWRERILEIIAGNPTWTEDEVSWTLIEDYGPAHIASELRRAKYGGFAVSANGVYRVLRRHGIHTRALRCGLLAGYAAPPEPAREPEPEGHIEVSRPGELVQMDCFCIGRLSGTKGVVW